MSPLGSLTLNETLSLAVHEYVILSPRSAGRLKVKFASAGIFTDRADTGAEIAIRTSRTISDTEAAPITLVLFGTTNRQALRSALT